MCVEGHKHKSYHQVPSSGNKATLLINVNVLRAQLVLLFKNVSVYITAFLSVIANLSNKYSQNKNTSCKRYY
jgi:hypothetical protein